MRFFACLVIALIGFQGVGASAAAKIKAPEPGYGIVVIELLHPEAAEYQAISSELLRSKKGDAYRKNPQKLASEAWKVWREANGLDYGLILGTRVPDTGLYDVVAGVWNYQYGMGAIIESSVELYRDEVTGRLWYVGEVPAGDAVIYGLNVQTYWQIRFDAGAPHFVVPDGGFVFVGTLDGVLNRQRVIKAIADKALPASINSHSFPMATCDNLVEGYFNAAGNDDRQVLAEAFLSKQLGEKVVLTSLETDARAFESKRNDGWVKGASHRCAKAKP